MKTVNFAVIGCGYWGPNYVRILNELDGGKVTLCCDLDRNNLKKIEDIYPGMRLSDDYREVAKNPDIDAVVITTPHNTHHRIAKLCLLGRKDVLIEKPFTANSREAEELVALSSKEKLTLMVGHVYRYNPAVVQLGQICKAKGLGNIYYANAERFGLGPIRKYANALWDLATHDISIAINLLNSYPKEVTAIGEHYIQHNIKDVVFISMKFPSRAIYNIYASWLSPEKVRKTALIGSKGMAVFDDVNKSETLKVYDRRINTGLLGSTPEYSDHQLVVNIGDVHILKVEQKEPLKNQVEHFLDCVRRRRRPLTDGREGLAVVKILEAAEKSLKTGRPVKCR